MIRYLTVEEIKQRNILNGRFCRWVDELAEICIKQLELTVHDAPLKLDEVACINDFNAGIPPYFTFRETHFNT